MHLTGDSSDGTEVEVMVVEAEHDMHNVLDMVLHESERPGFFILASCRL